MTTNSATQIAVIERANVDDARAIAEVHVRSWQWAYRGLLPDAFLDGLDVDARAAMWARRLADPSLVVAVSRVNDRVVGFCACGPSRDAERARAGLGEVYAIYVDAERSGEGDGRALLQLGTSSIAAATVELWVIAANARARRFYEKHGFCVDGAEEIDDIGGGARRGLRYGR